MNPIISTPKSMTHRERLQACLAGQATDRPPVALWRHFPVDDQQADSLAEASTRYQHMFDWDFVKVTPASSFCLRDWGVEDEWRGDSEGTRFITKRVILEPQDWERLPILTPHASYITSQVTCLRILRQAIEPETPIIQTIFNPLAQARNLAGADTLLAHLRLHPSAVMKGLETISATTAHFIQAIVESGMDGIFYAVQHAQAGILTRDEFNQFSRPFDLQLLKQAEPLWFNLLHLHGTSIYFDLVRNYPVQAINWHDRETSPSLAEAQGLRVSGKANSHLAVCGGLKRETVALKTPGHIQNEIQEAITATNGRGFILGTGCVVPIIAPYGNLMAVRKAVENTG